MNPSESRMETRKESTNPGPKKSTAATCAKSCNNCIVCVYFVLIKFRLYCNSYRHLYAAYKVALTLSCTQVACERSFSKLKYIKNRLRSRLHDILLEPLMLMNIERSILNELTNDEVIAEISRLSSEHADLLYLPQVP